MIEERLSPNGLVKEYFDNENPRFYARYYRCVECGEWIDEEDVVWIDTDRSGEYNSPYHDHCAPPEVEGDSDLAG